MKKATATCTKPYGLVRKTARKKKKKTKERKEKLISPFSNQSHKSYYIHLPPPFIGLVLLLLKDSNGLAYSSGSTKVII